MGGDCWYAADLLSVLIFSHKCDELEQDLYCLDFLKIDQSASLKTPVVILARAVISVTIPTYCTSYFLIYTSYTSVNSCMDTLEVCT